MVYRLYLLSDDVMIFQVPMQCNKGETALSIWLNKEKKLSKHPCLPYDQEYNKGNDFHFNILDTSAES